MSVSTSLLESFSPEGPFEILECDEHHAKARAYNMLFMVWRKETTSLAYRRAISIVDDLASFHPEGVGVTQVVEESAMPPSSETRALFIEFLRRPHVKHYSVTHEGHGIKAAAVRAIATASSTMARPSGRHSTHGSIESASTWVAEQQRAIGFDESPSEIADRIQRLRERLRAEYPD